MRIEITGILSKMGVLRPSKIMYIGGSDVLPPPLKGADEQRMLELLSRGDAQAKQILIEHNLRLVVYIARRFENTGVNLEDLISIGTRDDRPHQGGGNLPNGQKDQAGDLRLPVH